MDIGRHVDTRRAGHLARRRRQPFAGFRRAIVGLDMAFENFSMGFHGLVQPGAQPMPLRLIGIREQFLDQFADGR